MTSERVIVISDVHLDQWKDDLPDDHQAKRQAFLDFLGWIAQMGSEGKIRRFVIAGDLINVPQKDRAPLLPTYGDVYAALQAISAAGVRFGYVIGNHDSGMVGFSLKLDNPEVCVGYPYLLVNSGSSQFAVEHGHMHDPWLWDYVRQLGASMWTNSAGPAGGQVLGVRAAAATPSANPTDAAVQIGELWQAGLREPGVAPESTETLQQLLLDDLQQDNSDIMDPGKDSEMIAARESLRSQFGIAPAGGVAATSLSMAPAAVGASGISVEKLVQAYYSGPHWRRAAKRRLPELAAEVGHPLAGILMGHTHYADQFTWQDGAGASPWYINSGSWRHDSADLVIIEDENVECLKRKWTDDLPTL